jgi:hypothetical protein
MVTSQVFYLEHIYTLTSDVTEDLILVIEMPSKHLGRLIHCMFNFHRNAAASLRFLDNLRGASQFYCREDVQTCNVPPAIYG